MSENKKKNKGMPFRSGLTIVTALALLAVTSAAYAQGVPVHELPKQPNNKNSVTVDAKDIFYIGNQMGKGDSYVGVTPDGALVEVALPDNEGKEGRLYLDKDGHPYAIEIGRNDGGNSDEGAEEFKVLEGTPDFSQEIKDLRVDVAENCPSEYTSNDYSHNLHEGKKHPLTSGMVSAREKIVNKAKAFFAKFNPVQLAGNQNVK